jgi:hypothetical protein
MKAAQGETRAAPRLLQRTCAPRAPSCRARRPGGGTPWGEAGQGEGQEGRQGVRDK